MYRAFAAVILLVMSLAARSVAAQSSQGTTPASQSGSQQITLTGCLRQTSDDSSVFALVPSLDEAKTAGTSEKWLVDFESRPVIIATDVAVVK